MSRTGFETLLTAIEPDAEPAIQAHSDVRERLASHKTFKDVHVDTFLAGSYRRRTARHPIKDVDVVVVLDEEQIESEPQAVISLLDDTLASYDEYKRRRRENRRSIQIKLPDIDMDIVPTVALYGPDDELRIPDRDVKQWMRTHPKGHIDWIQDLNGLTTPIGSRGTLVPLVKLLKQWKATCFGSVRHPKGFMLELFAGYSHDPTAETWDSVFVRFLENLTTTYAPYRRSGIVPALPDPGLPGEHIATGMTAEDFNRLLVLADTAIVTSRAAQEAETKGEERRGSELWRTLFGEAYPLASADHGKRAATPAAAASVFARPDIRQAPRFG